MKKLILILCLLLISCGSNPPKIGDKEAPFIVVTVEKYTDKLSRYYSERQEDGRAEALFTSYHEVILPKGLFAVGDTIKLNHFK